MDTRIRSKISTRQQQQQQQQQTEYFGHVCALASTPTSIVHTQIRKHQKALEYTILVGRSYQSEPPVPSDANQPTLNDWWMNVIRERDEKKKGKLT